MASKLPGNLSGDFHVRVLRDAFKDAHRLMPKMRDRARLRRQALKLRFWPENHPEDEGGQVLDIDWSWIQALKSQGHKIGELRINETIGGHDNLRLIFYLRTGESSIPTIWVLGVMQKKRDDFSKYNVAVFKGRKTLVDERGDHI